jgi:DNA-binding beta-propeller fold protein YncE
MLQHVTTYRLRRVGANTGVAVSADGSTLLVANAIGKCVDVYDTATGVLTRSVGEDGSRFVKLEKLCVSTTGTVLAVDRGAGRVEEFTLTGDHVRFLSTGPRVGSVAATASLIAVGLVGGTDNNRITLHDCMTGDTVATWGAHGTEPGQLGDCDGLRFAPGGGWLYVAEDFRVSELLLNGRLRAVYTAPGLESPDDVELVAGLVIVSDWARNRLTVWPHTDPDAAKHVGEAGGHKDGEFFRPTSLASHGSTLYVLDSSSGRVQAFTVSGSVGCL